MEQEAHPTGLQVVVVVVRIDQPAAAAAAARVADHHDSSLPGAVSVVVNGDTTTTRQETTTVNHHAIDVGRHQGDDDACPDSESLCIVCKEPLLWVAIGRCGHRAVCRRCTVRLRFFHRNKRCRVCTTRCPTVVVAKRSARADIMSTLPLFSLREGRVGRFWYHRLTAAYYEDEQEYQAARAACQGILSPFFQPWYLFLLLLVYFTWMGVYIGWGSAHNTKHRSGKVRAYAFSTFGGALVAMIIWSAVKCAQDPLAIEDSRRRANQ